MVKVKNAIILILTNYFLRNINYFIKKWFLSNFLIKLTSIWSNKKFIQQLILYFQINNSFYWWSDKSIYK